MTNGSVVAAFSGTIFLPKRDTVGSTLARRLVHALSPQAIRHGWGVFHHDVTLVPPLPVNLHLYPLPAPGNPVRHQTACCPSA